MQTLSLSDALFTATQQRILGLLFGKPDHSFYANEIARWAKVGKGSLMRELERLQRAGVLTLSRQGNQTHYQANPACPIYQELLGIVRKTFGITEHLRLALAPFAEQLAWAFVYGSIAKDQAHAGSDIDLMLIGDGLHYSEVMERLLPMEEQRGRTINPTLYSLEDWNAKLAAGNSFVQRVVKQDKLNIMGGTPWSLRMDKNESLENLQRSGALKAEPADRKECEGLMRSAIDRLQDARTAQLSFASCFDLAYNAAPT